jgi:hypothetical protein
MEKHKLKKKLDDKIEGNYFARNHKSIEDIWARN